METRSWLLAKTLARHRDFDVSFLVRVPRKPAQEVFEQVRVIGLVERMQAVRESVFRLVTRQSGFPGLRIRKFRLRLLWQLPLLLIASLWRRWTYPQHAYALPRQELTQLDADVLITFGVNVVSAAVVASAKASGKKSILMIAHEMDLDDRYRPDSQFVTQYNDPAPACHYALQHADRIVVQSETQRSLLASRFQRESALIKNPIDLAQWEAWLESESRPAELEDWNQYILWVGRADRTLKNPELYVQLAQQNPEHKFLMIMNPYDAEVENQIRTSPPPNLKIISRIPFRQMPAVYREASLFVSTSNSEGFPNTFLQAAASGVPIASWVVGEEFLRTSGAGECAGGSVARLTELIEHKPQKLSNSERDAMREYLRKHHSLDSAVEQLVNLLRSL